MAKSSAFPSLERKKGGPDNWVERVGGLPQYIERIAKHLHYERGMSISHAIATAVNTVKRWARKGSVVKYNDPNNKHVTTITAAQAARDVAEWEAKKARAGLGGRRSGRLRTRSIRLSEESVNFAALAERANSIADVEARVAARRALFDLAFPKGTVKIDLADGPNCAFCVNPATKKLLYAEGKAYMTTCDRHLGKGKFKAERVTPDGTPDPTNIDSITDLTADDFASLELALTKDGRKSFKRQGKWGHGFVPLDEAAKRSKAKGSNIAMKRMNRLYGSPSKAEIARKKAVKSTLAKRKDQKPGTGMPAPKLQTGGTKSKGTERVQRAGQARRADLRDAAPTVRGTKPEPKKEVSKGGGRSNPRATRAWNTIASEHKTIRNGKRYVVGNYNGKQFLTEWVGENPSKSAPDLAKRGIRSIQMSKLEQMDTATLRRMLKLGKLSPEVRKKVNKVLAKKMEEKRTRA